MRRQPFWVRIVIKKLFRPYLVEISITSQQNALSWMRCRTHSMYSVRSGQELCITERIITLVKAILAGTKMHASNAEIEHVWNCIESQKLILRYSCCSWLLTGDACCSWPPCIRITCFTRQGWSALHAHKRCKFMPCRTPSWCHLLLLSSKCHIWLSDAQMRQTMDSKFLRSLQVNHVLHSDELLSLQKVYGAGIDRETCSCYG